MRNRQVNKADPRSAKRRKNSSKVPKVNPSSTNSLKLKELVVEKGK